MGYAPSVKIWCRPWRHRRIWKCHYSTLNAGEIYLHGHLGHQRYQFVSVTSGYWSIAGRQLFVFKSPCKAHKLQNRVRCNESPTSRLTWPMTEAEVFVLVPSVYLNTKPCYHCDHACWGVCGPPLWEKSAYSTVEIVRSDSNMSGNIDGDSTMH